MKPRTKHLKHSRFAEIFGWIASFLILGDYALLSFNLFDNNSIVYHAILLVGSLGLAVVTYRHRAFQSLTVNTFFALLSTLAIIRILFFK